MDWQQKINYILLGYGSRAQALPADIRQMRAEGSADYQYFAQAGIDESNILSASSEQLRKLAKHFDEKSTISSHLMGAAYFNDPRLHIKIAESHGFTEEGGFIERFAKYVTNARDYLGRLTKFHENRFLLVREAKTAQETLLGFLRVGASFETGKNADILALLSPDASARADGCNFNVSNSGIAENYSEINKQFVDRGIQQLQALPLHGEADKARTSYIELFYKGKRMAQQHESLLAEAGLKSNSQTASYMMHAVETEMEATHPIKPVAGMHMQPSAPSGASSLSEVVEKEGGTAGHGAEEVLQQAGKAGEKSGKTGWIVGGIAAAVVGLGALLYVNRKKDNHAEQENARRDQQAVNNSAGLA